MTLAFSQQINDKPNYFIEKIWDSLLLSSQNIASIFSISYEQYLSTYDHRFGAKWDIKGLITPKLHTIRNGNRWKAGNLIHPVINNRTPKRFQFAPTFNCVGVQEIIIGTFREDCLTGNPILDRFVSVDGKLLKYDQMLSLAINDGFESVEDFFAYFNKDFKGQIIHWTDLRY